MKSVLWRIVKRLSYVQDARSLKVNVIVLALEIFPSFLSTWASYLHSQPSELASARQETTLEIIFFLAMNAVHV